MKRVIDMSALGDLPRILSDRAIFPELSTRAFRLPKFNKARYRWGRRPDSETEALILKLNQMDMELYEFATKQSNYFGKWTELLSRKKEKIVEIESVLQLMSLNTISLWWSPYTNAYGELCKMRGQPGLSSSALQLFLEESVYEIPSSYSKVYVRFLHV